MRVSLVASPASVEEQRQVTFSAQVSRSVPNLQYRFNFGDGSQPSGWQSSAQAEHTYEKAGRYFPFVDIRDGNRQLGGSQKQSVAVTKPRSPSLSVSLIANRRSTRSRQPVTFSARVTPRSADTKYWFDFGDGSQPLGWQASSQATHTYSQPGSYPAYVQVSQLYSGANMTAMSSPVSVYVQRPTPTPGPGPSPQPSPRPTAYPSPTPSPSPNASPSPTANTSPTPVGGTSPTPDGSPSPGPTTSPNPGDSPAGGNASPSPTADTSQSSSPSYGRRTVWWPKRLVEISAHPGADPVFVLSGDRPFVRRATCVHSILRSWCCRDRRYKRYVAHQFPMGSQPQRHSRRLPGEDRRAQSGNERGRF